MQRERSPAAVETERTLITRDQNKRTFEDGQRACETNETRRENIRRLGATTAREGNKTEKRGNEKEQRNKLGKKRKYKRLPKTSDPKSFPYQVVSPRSSETTALYSRRDAILARKRGHIYFRESTNSLRASPPDTSLPQHGET